MLSVDFFNQTGFSHEKAYTNPDSAVAGVECYLDLAEWIKAGKWALLTVKGKSSIMVTSMQQLGLES